MLLWKTSIVVYKALNKYVDVLELPDVRANPTVLLDVIVRQHNAVFVRVARINVDTNPERSESLQHHTEWSSRPGSEPSSVKADVYVRCCALLVVHVRKEDEEESSPTSSYWHVSWMTPWTPHPRHTRNRWPWIRLDLTATCRLMIIGDVSSTKFILGWCSGWLHDSDSSDVSLNAAAAGADNVDCNCDRLKTFLLTNKLAVFVVTTTSNR